MNWFKTINRLLSVFAIAACSTESPETQDYERVTSTSSEVVSNIYVLNSVPLEDRENTQLTIPGSSCADLSLISRETKNQQLCRIISCNQSRSRTDLMNQLDILLPNYTFENIIFRKSDDNMQWHLACSISDSDGQRRFFRASNSSDIPDRVSRTLKNHSDQTWFMGSGNFDFDMRSKNPLDLGMVYFRQLTVLSFAGISDDYSY